MHAATRVFSMLSGKILWFFPKTGTLNHIIIRQSLTLVSSLKKLVKVLPTGS